MSEGNLTVEKQEAGAFYKWFWRTVIALFVVTVCLIILGAINSSDGAMKDAANKRAISEEAAKLISPTLARVFSTVAKDPFSDLFKQKVSRLVDQAFQPAYSNVPKFADAHYSVVGEYVEMGSAAVGGMARHIQQQIFPNLGERLHGVSQEVANMIPQELQRRLREEAKSAAAKANIPEKDRAAFESLIAQELSKYNTTFRNSMAVGGGLVGAVGAMAAIKLISTQVARKILAKLAVKFTAKLATKGSGIAGGAAAGAAVGSAVPVLGTAIGGVIGGLVGWVAVDAAFVTVDEWLNRDDFENELRASITAQRENVKRQIIAKAEAMKNALISHARENLKGKAPVDL